MHIQQLHVLIQTLLSLFFWLSITGAYPAPKSVMDTPSRQYQPLSLRQPRGPPSETPHATPSNLEDPYIPIVASYNLKFKKYSHWIKEQSKSLWGSRRKNHQEVDDARHDYVSPYLTQFEEKKDGLWAWFDFGRLWRHFLWEVIPEWFGGPSPAPKEDVFLLRAMEQPSYMSVYELPDTFRVTQVVNEEGKEIHRT